jgi:secreted PhoX family phosphatase
MTVSISRRRFLSVSASVPVAAAVALSAWQAEAATGTATPAAAAAAAQLTMDDPRAPALGYVTDAAKAKGDAMFKPGSNCANCSQLKGQVGEKLRPCALFPDLKNPKQLLLVNTGGWCRSWTAIPKAS